MDPTDALILNFDDSVLPLSRSTGIDLGTWQEEIRFGCRMSSLRRLQAAIVLALAQQPRIVFMGSGDYHHVTCLLLERYRNLGQPIQLVVFDNHPDNMRYAFGIHCGSWVWHASRLPFVAQVHVLGITSTDVEAAHAWENHLRPLMADKVRYWCVGRNLSWMKRLGIKHSHSFSSMQLLLKAFAETIATTAEPIYLSIDKDVLAPEDAHTNWDQGVMRVEELQQAISLVGKRIIAVDVVGEVSAYRYNSLFKRVLSGMDGQPAIPQEDLAEWQAQHQRINEALLESLMPG
ncbi:MAG TPA: arginase family protein [Novimethylophilus sp.]|jgi:arginase family enzyme|uniref:arginase family protein n=1 Tax=Novimethylophilus sp. TaxID=2137426 RepID=UPI002F3E3DEA